MSKNGGEGMSLTNVERKKLEELIESVGSGHAIIHTKGQGQSLQPMLVQG